MKPIYIKKILALFGLYLVMTLSLYAISDYFFSQKPTPPQEAKLLLQVDNENDWIRGNKEAGKTLVEYCDFQEPVCAEYYPLIKEALTQTDNQVRLVYRHYPVRDSHPQADLAARFTESAGKQGKFWEMHDLLYEKKAEWEDKDNAKEVMLTLAETIGIDTKVMEPELESDEIKKAVDGDLYGGLASGIQNVPTLFLDGTLVKLPINKDEFVQLFQGSTTTE